MCYIHLIILSKYKIYLIIVKTINLLILLVGSLTSTMTNNAKNPLNRLFCLLKRPRVHRDSYDFNVSLSFC